MAELKFQTFDLDDIPQGVCVKLGGIIDVTTANTFRATLLTLLSVGFRRILLDFKDVEFINSTGFASMVELSQHLRDTGGIVVLSQMRPEIEDICVDLGLDAFFGIAHSEADALKVLAESQVRPVDDLEDDDGNAAEFYIGPETNTAAARTGRAGRDANVPRPSEQRSRLIGADTDELTAGLQFDVEDAMELDFRASSDNIDLAKLVGDVELEGPSRTPAAVAQPSVSGRGELDELDSPELDWTPPGAAAESADMADAITPQPAEVLDPEPVTPFGGVAAPPANHATAPRPGDAKTRQRISVGKSPQPHRGAANEAGIVRDRSAADRARAAAGLVAPQPGRPGIPAADRRTYNLQAMATLLATIPQANRLWRKVLVYVSRDARTQAPSLNLVLAKLPHNKATPDAFLLSDANPYVTIVPRIPNAITVPQRLSVDVTKGGDEITFKVQVDKNPNRAGAATGRPRLEIWYGPTLLRTVRTPNPFDA